MKKLILYVLIDLATLVLGVWAVTLPATGVFWIDYPAYVATLGAFLMLLYDLHQIHHYRSNQPWS